MAASFSLSETAQISATTTDKEATFGDGTSGSGVQQIYVKVTADTYIDFDQPAVSSRSFLLTATDSPFMIDFHGGSVMKMHAMAKTTSIVYIIGIRN